MQNSARLSVESGTQPSGLPVKKSGFMKIGRVGSTDHEARLARNRDYTQQRAGELRAQRHASVQSEEEDGFPETVRAARPATREAIEAMQEAADVSRADLDALDGWECPVFRLAKKARFVTTSNR